MKSCCKDALAPEQDTEQMPAKQSKAKTWLKRIGIAGFLFFLVKGLLWLAFGSAVLSRIAGCS